MKKILILILVVTLALSLSSCNIGLFAGESKTTPSGSAGSSDTTQAPDNKPNDTPQGSQNAGKSNYNNWEAFYNAFSAAYNQDSDKFSDREDVGLDAAFALLSGDIDLAFTSAYFNESASSTVPMAYGFFGWTDVAYSESGDTASVTATGEDGTLTHELIYSKGNAAKFRSVSSDGTECTLTVCLTDQYWAKSYISADSEVRAVGYKDGSFYLGTGSGGGTLLSLYDNPNAAADPSFVTGMNKVWELKDGQLTTK